MLLHPALNHKIVQVAYIVNDLQDAAARWTKSFGIGPFYVLERPEVRNPLYRGKPGPVSFSTAIAQAGEIHIELLEQHCDSPSCYRDLIPKGKEGFHHVAVLVDDYATEIARYEELGCPIAGSGEVGPLKFAYIDTSAVMHGMVEILENRSFIRKYFAAIRNVAETWDGSRPIRKASELAG
jgi:catechol 2,3-dioxygenase-like lactoylglutathione lyase family enzyme